MNKLFLLLSIVFSLVLVSCDNDSDDGFNDVVADCGKYYPIKEGNTMTIENEFIASYSEGFLQARHVGETTAICNGKHKIKITVNGTVKFIDYPVTEWGASKSDVIKMHKYGKLTSNANDDILYFDTMNGSKVQYRYGYEFKNGRLYAAGITIPSYDEARVMTWLSEKYYLTKPTSKDLVAFGYDSYNYDYAKTILGISSFSANTSMFVSSVAYEVLFADKSQATRSTSGLNFVFGGFSFYNSNIAFE